MNTLQEKCMQSISENIEVASNKKISRKTFNTIVKVLVENKKMNEKLMKHLTSKQSLCISFDLKNSYNVVLPFVNKLNDAGIHGLVFLNLSGCSKFDGPSIRFLKDLPLFSLDLSNTKVQDSDLKEIIDMRSLKKLQLNGTKITDSGMKHLAGFSLESLGLCKTHITDEGIDEFTNSNINTSLQTFDISNTKVTDESLEALATFPCLVQLNVFQCPISVANLKKILSKDALNKSVKVSSLSEFEIVKHNPILTQTPLTNNSDWCMESLKKYIEEIPDFNERNKTRKGRLSSSSLSFNSLSFESSYMAPTSPKVAKKESAIVMTPLATCRDSFSGKKSLSPVSNSFDFDEEDSFVEEKLPEVPKVVETSQNISKKKKLPKKLAQVPKEIPFDNKENSNTVSRVPKDVPRKPLTELKEIPKVPPKTCKNEDPEFALVMMLIGENKGRRLRTLVEETAAEIKSPVKDSPIRTARSFIRTPSPIRRSISPIFIDLSNDVRQEIARDLQLSNPEKDCSVSSSPVQLLEDPDAGEISWKTQKRKRESLTPIHTPKKINSPSDTPLKSSRAKEAPKTKRRPETPSKTPITRSSSRAKRQRVDCNVM